MKSSGKLIGILLAIAGILVISVVSVWLLSAEGLTRGGRSLGFIFALLLSAPLIGVGVFMIQKSRQEGKALAEISRQRKLLNIVKTQGQVTISDLVLELNATFDQVKNWIYDLVGKGLFSGYVNWEEGTLYSQQASLLRGETSCKHCGGAVNFAGKGVIRCPYCGTEYFVS